MQIEGVVQGVCKECDLVWGRNKELTRQRRKGNGEYFRQTAHHVQRPYGRKNRVFLQHPVLKTERRSASQGIRKQKVELWKTKAKGLRRMDYTI
jgi:hypothetical protein